MAWRLGPLSVFFYSLCVWKHYIKDPKTRFFIVAVKLCLYSQKHNSDLRRSFTQSVVGVIAHLDYSATKSALTLEITTGEVPFCTLKTPLPNSQSHLISCFTAVTLIPGDFWYVFWRRKDDFTWTMRTVIQSFSWGLHCSRAAVLQISTENIYLTKSKTLKFPFKRTKRRDGLTWLHVSDPSMFITPRIVSSHWASDNSQVLHSDMFAVVKSSEDMRTIWDCVKTFRTHTWF